MHLIEQSSQDSRPYPPLPQQHSQWLSIFSQRPAGQPDFPPERQGPQLPLAGE